MSDTGLYLNPAQADPEPTQPVVGFTTPELNPTSQITGIPKGRFWQAPALLGTTPSQDVYPAQDLIHGDQGVPLWSVYQPEVLTNSTYKRAGQWQSRKKNPLLEHEAWVIWKIVTVSAARHLHHKTIKTSMGNIADLPNTQRPNGDTKKKCSKQKNKRNPQKNN